MHPLLILMEEFDMEDPMALDLSKLTATITDSDGNVAISYDGYDILHSVPFHFHADEPGALTAAQVAQVAEMMVSGVGGSWEEPPEVRFAS